MVKITQPIVIGCMIAIPNLDKIVGIQMVKMLITQPMGMIGCMIDCHSESGQNCLVSTKLG